MPIPAAHAHRFVYHSTHINNLEGILRHGFLSHNEQTHRGLKHHTIAAAGIQQRRAVMPVPCGPGGVVHDYVPLYFTKLSPMLLQVVQAKNVDQKWLLHFAFPINILDRPEVVFTDEAANSDVAPNFFTDPAELVHLDWAAIDLRKWKSLVNDVDRKHQRMAEALSHGSLDPNQAAFVVVWNEHVKKQVQEVYAKVGVLPPKLAFDGPNEHHGFTHWDKKLPSDMRDHSIASGPLETRHRFDTTTLAIAAQVPSPTPRFASLSAMLAALQTIGLAAVPETAELLGLESVNEVHKHDVGTHTMKVVEKLRASTDFAGLSDDDKVVVEVAAYLHDIGKGPKARWAACNGKQQVDSDHPIRSMEMLPRILRDEVALDGVTARLLCKLVCYHDLVGDIVGKGRDRQQLLDIAEHRRDLDLLILLGKADMTSVADAWGWAGAAKLPALRAWVAAELPE